MASLKFTGEISLEEVYSQNRDLIYDSLVKSIQGVYLDPKINDIQVVKIEINNLEYSIKLDRNKFVVALENVIAFYEELEEYEKCQNCLDIITELNKKKNQKKVWGTKKKTTKST